MDSERCVTSQSSKLRDEQKARELRRANRLAINQIHPGNLLRLMAGLALLPVEDKPRKPR